jgi:hypothetical protein
MIHNGTGQFTRYSARLRHSKVLPNSLLWPPTHFACYFPALRMSRMNRHDYGEQSRQNREAKVSEWSANWKLARNGLGGSIAISPKPTSGPCGRKSILATTSELTVIRQEP